MQIFGPIPVAGIQDSSATQVAAAAPIAPVTAAAAGGNAGQARSETGERGQTPPRPTFPRPDPDRPSGPPPAFDTTPLELEQERRQSDAANFWRTGSAPESPEPPARNLDIEV